MLSAPELAGRLAREAEAVCRHYLSAGHRAGNYWIVGDLANSKGCSLYVRLTGPRAGKWTDAATGQHGDLLDLVRERCGLDHFRDVAEEVHQFLHFLQCAPASCRRNSVAEPAAVDLSAVERARRLFDMAQPMAGTLADAYLRKRRIMAAWRHAVLRFHPACYYRDLLTGSRRSYPALIAAVTGGDGAITGVHRTWLDPDGDGKAKIADPRRALGQLLGNGVRFRFAIDAPVPVMTAGEGLETVLSLAAIMPDMPMVAALSAAHLAALQFPAGCLRIYIAVDADPAGRRAGARLSRRARQLGILPLVLLPELGDFNEDLCRLGADRMVANLRAQLIGEDATTFLSG